MLYFKKNAQLTGLFLAFVCLSFFYLWTTQFESSNFSLLLLLSIKTLLVVSIILVLIVFLFQFSLNKAGCSAWAKNGMLTVCSIFISIFVLEGIFIFIPYSHTSGYTLAAKRWRDYYWHPINELGYRDQNVFNDPFTRYKKKIFVIGDSFTAGQGINHIRDRFSDQLARRIPEHYHVLNFGRNGNDSATEIHRLLNIPFAPDLLVLQYYANDIEGIARVNGELINKGKHFDPKTRYYNLNTVGKWFVKHSYLLNFIYWQLEHLDETAYRYSFRKVFSNTGVLLVHQEEFTKLFDYAKEKAFSVIIVIFPFMADLEEGTAFLDSMRYYFESEGAHVINVADLIQDLSVRERVINKKDVHASVEVNHRVAAALYDLIVENNFLSEDIWE